LKTGLGYIVRSYLETQNQTNKVNFLLFLLGYTTIAARVDQHKKPWVWAGGLAQVVERLPSKWKTLRLSPSTTKKKKKKRNLG
jgi:hypothetical protein